MGTKTKNVLLWTIVSLVLLIIAILGTIFDLQISKALADVQFGENYHSTNLFAIIGETFGENILYIFIVLAFGILFFYLRKNSIAKKWVNVCLQIAMFVGSYIITFYCLHKVLEYLSIYTNFGLDEYIISVIGLISVALVSLAVNIGSFYLISKISDDNINRLWKWALVVLIVAILSNGIVQFSKRIFDRTRYRAMVHIGDSEFNYFDYWFTFNTNKFSYASPYFEDFFRSFPSGHTCAAASSFLLVLLPLFLPQTDNKKWKTIFWVSSISYTLLVALSRLIAGAHFFMDVFVGGMVTFVIVMIAYYICYKLKQKEKDKENASIKSKKRTAC